MPNYTPNLNLVKPLVTEQYDIAKVTNENADKIDLLLAPKANPTFTGLTELPLTTTLGGQDIRTLLMPKNWIINGMFDVWQRGTTQTTIGYGSDDRFLNYNQLSNKTHSRQAFTIGQTDVPNNPTYFSRTVVTSEIASTSFTFKQTRIEDVTKLAGKTITISFWAKADANKNLSIELAQQFGDGGSSDVVGIGIQKFALTTSWQRFTKTVTLPSVSGKTVGLNNRIEFNIWFDAGSNFNARTNSLGNQSGTFDIANVSLVEGSVAVECQNQPYADVLRDCQRYYLPLVQAGFGGNYVGLSYGMVRTSTMATLKVNLFQEMRATPALFASGIFTLHANNSTNIDVSIPENCFIDSLVATKSSVIISFKASELTQGYACFVERGNNTTGYIALSAEL